MNMHVEAREAERVDERHFDRAVVLKLAAGNGALPGVKAVCLDEFGCSARLLGHRGMGPRVLAERPAAMPDCTQTNRRPGPFRAESDSRGRRRPEGSWHPWRFAL
jgi:hypothetical protein